MLGQAVVDRKLTLLDTYVGYPEELATRPAAEFAGSFLVTGAARYYLQVAIECCIDIGAHVLAADTARRAEDYRAVFRLLAEERVIGEDTARAMDPAAALRNRLVHGYERVDDARVHAMLAGAATTFRAFAREIAAYLERSGHQPR